MIELLPSGIDARTGEPLTPPLSPADLLEQALAGSGPADDGRLLTYLAAQRSEEHLGLPFDVEPTDLAQAGWGLVLPEGLDPAVAEALQPLVAHRATQIGDPALTHRLTYHPGETPAAWLARHGVGAGTVDPTHVPYYLLLVGGPRFFPFPFCHLLDVEYAVGCLELPTPQDYARYAEAVVAHETGPPAAAREAAFFATAHRFDPATQLSSRHLATPLAEGDPTATGRRRQSIASRCGYTPRFHVGEEARQPVLRNLLCGDPAGPPRPSLVFFAGHGLGYAAGDEAQRSTQGALLCAEWPGRGAPPAPAHYLSAADLPPEGSSAGLIAFFYACFGAGTPAFDRYSPFPDPQAQAAPAQPLAPEPFLASLPQALLARGALACIGHVDRAWAYSFLLPDAGRQLQPFESTLGRLLRGEPAGHALQEFNTRYATCSAQLLQLQEEAALGKRLKAEEVAGLWTQRNDAEGYLLLGDPAVRLGDGQAEAEGHQPGSTRSLHSKGSILPTPQAQGRPSHASHP